MSKNLLKKIQLGLVSFSVIALLAACATDGLDDPGIYDEPGVEEPADDEEDTGTGGSTEEEQDN